VAAVAEDKKKRDAPRLTRTDKGGGVSVHEIGRQIAQRFKSTALASGALAPEGRHSSSGTHALIHSHGATGARSRHSPTLLARASASAKAYRSGRSSELLLGVLLEVARRARP